MDSRQGTQESIEQISEGIVATAERVAPALVSLHSGRWRTTGVAFGGRGTLIAPAHALEGADEATVSTAEGARPAKVVGRDESLDLALLETDAALGELGWIDALPRPGQLVIGLSRPAGTLRSRIGQVIAVGGRSYTGMGGRLEHTLELAWIGRNPLATTILDLRGHALGLAIGGGGRRGWVLSTAILTRAVEQIRRLGKVKRGYLGVIAQPVRVPHEVAAHGVGLLVTAVEPDSPAARAGLLLGDTLLALGGEPIRSLADLWGGLGPERVGQKVRLQILRAGQAHEAELEIGTRR